MDDKPEEHFRRLERMYEGAGINQYFQPSMRIERGRAEVVVPVREDMFHAAGALHGSVYFKVLDDAAFFAANSLEQEVFVLTTTLTTYLTRPVSTGHIRAVGTVVNSNRTQWIAESVAYDSADREVGRATGIMVRSKVRLGPEIGYR